MTEVPNKRSCSLEVSPEQIDKCSHEVISSADLTHVSIYRALRFSVRLIFRERLHSFPPQVPCQERAHSTRHVCREVLTRRWIYLPGILIYQSFLSTNTFWTFPHILSHLLRLLINLTLIHQALLTTSLLAKPALTSACSDRKSHQRGAGTLYEFTQIKSESHMLCSLSTVFLNISSE